MLSDEMIAALRCPLCHSPLHSADHSLKCIDGHSFDQAKQGYFHLGTGRKLPAGDTAPMIEARSAFLAAGHFAPLTTAVTERVGDGLVVDLGSGPGHYLAHALHIRPAAQGLAFDVSKPALKRAALAHPRIGAILADTWARLPLADASVDCLLDIFAPRNGTEMLRVLRPDGHLIVVTPEPDHLAELRDKLGLLNVDESKPERLAATLSDFQPAGEELLIWTMDLSAEAAEQLILMGPNAFHGRGRSPDAGRVTASVRVTTWRGRPLPTRPAARGAAR